MKNNFNLFFIIFLSLFFSNLSFSANEESIYDKIDLFSEVLDKVNNEYVEEIDHSKAMDAAINGVLQSLDPYSAGVLSIGEITFTTPNSIPTSIPRPPNSPLVSVSISLKIFGDI